MPVIETATDASAGFHAGVAQQFTHYGTLRDNGASIDNPTGQYMNSSYTYLVAGFSFLEDRLALQLNVPFIARKFKRPEGFEIERGTVSGLGDLSLLASWTVFRTQGAGGGSEGRTGMSGKAVMTPREPDFSASLNVLAGLKFPTGSSSFLREETEEGHEHGDEHAPPPSGVHGHDLALGSGSWDGVFGVEFFTSYKWMFFQAELQYAVRSEGDYSYRYANQLSWSGGPGAYLMREQGRSIAFQAVVSGETKGTDTFEGETAPDTGLTSLYVGPRLLASFGSWTMDVGCDLSVVANNTEVQITPDYRIRAAITYNF